MVKERKTDWRDVEDDNLGYEKYLDLPLEELERMSKENMAQIRKEIVEGKRDLD